MKNLPPTILALLFSCCLLPAMAQPVRRHGQLSVQGTQLTDAHHQPVVLRGMSLGWHNFQPRFFNKAMVHTLYKDWHCSVVRAAMGIEPKNAYKEDSAEAIARVRAVVDGAIREGIYVIIDWHSHNINLPEAKQFFSHMATLYGHYPNVLYELFNEPDYESWPEVKSYAQQVIAAIRAIDPDNIILVGNPHWDQDIQLPALDPIQGCSNLMYTVHYYAASHKQWLRDRADTALQKGLPVFISECAGMDASGNGPLNDAEWDAWIRWAESRKVSWVTWSLSDKNETCSVLQESASDTGPWKKKDLKTSGIQVRRYLKKYSRR